MSNALMLALLAQPREGGNGAAVFLVEMALIFLIFYWLLIRPQRVEQQKRKAMIQAAQKGDEVMLSSGIIGTIVKADEARVTIKSEESRLLVDRSGIAAVLSGQTEKD